MEENKQLNLEGDKLNQDKTEEQKLLDLQAQQQEIENANKNEDWTVTVWTKTYTEEDFKKLQSDSEKWVQKLLKQIKDWEGQTSFYQSVIKESKKVGQDEKYLAELMITKPNVAKEILKEYYDWMSYDEFKSEYWIKDSEINVDVLSELKAEKLYNNRMCNFLKEQYIAKSNLSESEKQLFNDNFNDIVEWKSIKPENIDKYLDISYTYLKKESNKQDKVEDKIELIAKQMANWWSSSWTTTWKKWYVVWTTLKLLD